MNDIERGQFEATAARNQFREYESERNFWPRMHKIMRQPTVMVPPGGDPGAEVLKKIESFLRPNEKWSQFVSRTQLGPAEILRMSKRELAAIIESRSADSQGMPIVWEQMQPRPVPRRIVLDVDNL